MRRGSTIGHLSLWTRNHNVPHTLPKQLIPVANRPILYYVLDHLREGKRQRWELCGDHPDQGEGGPAFADSEQHPDVAHLRL